ncbi:MAG: MotA/TolQ/ExbB proton channel family protein [Desulfobulbaceae bacterium]|nr:MotA/TolQ/ExbB proton channel family protein [Desulfobulbaceae bacterium]HIJ77908.1 flagellar motor protein MotA [Deltaproteobacteria bacterium]
MKPKTSAGLLICVIIFLLGFSLHGNIGMYFNLAGLLIVVGGTAGATMIGYPLERLLIVYKVLTTTYRSSVKSPEDIVEILVDLSVKSRYKGILSLQEDGEETSILFLRRALGFLVDGLPAAHIRDILNTEMYFFKMRREESERVLRTIAHMLPSFGLIGSVVGLIGMLAGVGNTTTILATVPIALTSTLYGVVFSNFFFMPFATLIRERTEQELILKKIIMEGILAIEQEADPRYIERRLKAFLTPSSRQIQLISLKRIQERFKIKPSSENFAPRPTPADYDDRAMVPNLGALMTNPSEPRH